MLRHYAVLFILPCLVLCQANCGFDLVGYEPSNAGLNVGADADLGAGDDSGLSTAIDRLLAVPTHMNFAVDQNVTIAATKQWHLAFPDVTRLQDGSLMLVYRQGDSHVELTGKIMKQFGSADGLVWSDPEVLFDAPYIDDRDPSITTLSNGDVMVNYFQYRTIALAAGTLTVHHVFVSTSSDNGQTFAPFVQVDEGSMYPSCPTLDATGRWVDDQNLPVQVGACSSRVIENNGQLFLPVYGGSALNAANVARTPKWRVSLLETSGAPTWLQKPVLTKSATDSWFLEPAVLRLASGTMLMHIRTAQGSSPSNPGKILQSVSTDGQSWSEPTSLGFVGHAPDLYQLKNGIVLTAYRELDGSLQHKWVSFSWSSNDGKTWSAPVRVADCGNVECGYPSIVELDDQRFLMVYYAPGGTAIKGVIYHYTGS